MLRHSSCLEYCCSSRAVMDRMVIDRKTELMLTPRLQMQPGRTIESREKDSKTEDPPGTPKKQDTPGTRGVVLDDEPSLDLSQTNSDAGGETFSSFLLRKCCGRSIWLTSWEQCSYCFSRANFWNYLAGNPSSTSNFTFRNFTRQDYFTLYDAIHKLTRQEEISKDQEELLYDLIGRQDKALATAYKVCLLITSACWPERC